MRKLIAVSMMLGLVALASTASAHTFSGEWNGGGLATITVVAGTPVTLDVYVTVDGAGLADGSGIDTAIASVGFNPANTMTGCLTDAGPQLVGGAFFFPFSLAGTQCNGGGGGGGVGVAGTIDQATATVAAISGTVHLGSVTFIAQVTDAMAVGEVQLGVDGVVQGSFVFNPGVTTIATLIVPEPATAMLMGLGLFGLAVAGRKNR